jgi:hypothetical protein
MNNRYDECRDLNTEVSRIQLIISPVPEDETVVDQHDGDVLLPTEIMVSSHPNPLRGSTTITYSLPADGHVTVEVYDINGRRIAVLADAQKAAGFHGVIWSGKDSTGNAAASGVYFCRVRLEGRPTVMEKLIKI